MRRNSICEQSKKSPRTSSCFGGMTQGSFCSLIIGTMIQPDRSSDRRFDRKCDLSAWKSCRSPDKCRYRCRRGLSEITRKAACHGFCDRRRHGRRLCHSEITGGTFFVDNAVLAGPGLNARRFHRGFRRRHLRPSWFPARPRLISS